MLAPVFVQSPSIAVKSHLEILRLPKTSTSDGDRCSPLFAGRIFDSPAVTTHGPTQLRGRNFERLYFSFRLLRPCCPAFPEAFGSFVH